MNQREKTQNGNKMFLRKVFILLKLDAYMFFSPETLLGLTWFL